MQDAPSEIRKIVLKGLDTGTTIHPSVWTSPTFKLFVFVSSTFTDTQKERNFLMDELQFKLRAEAQKHGIQVILVDMRWGIKDENTLDHKTWIECAKGIHWCKQQSTGIAFMSLQGDKYGYTPIPKTVLQKDLDRHLADTHCSDDDKKLVFEWYTLDENAVPEEYVLRNLTKESESAFWGDSKQQIIGAYKQILVALRGLPFDTKRHAGLFVGKSVTEWEVRAAFGSHPIDMSRETAFCWSHRKLAGEVSNRDFRDTVDDDYISTSFGELEEFMALEFAQTPATAVQTYMPELTLADLQADAKEGNAKQAEYLKQFKSFATSSLEASLRSVVAQKEAWAEHGGGLGLSGALLSEMLHHSAFAHAKCTTFVGRRGLLDQTAAFLDAVPNREITDDKYDDLNPVHRFAGIAVAVVGVSGAGKVRMLIVAMHTHVTDSTPHT